MYFHVEQQRKGSVPYFKSFFSFITDFLLFQPCCISYCRYPRLDASFYFMLSQFPIVVLNTAHMVIFKIPDIPWPWLSMFYLL
jgi:hypothetical protein